MNQKDTSSILGIFQELKKLADETNAGTAEYSTEDSEWKYTVSIKRKRS